MAQGRGGRGCAAHAERRRDHHPCGVGSEAGLREGCGCYSGLMRTLRTLAADEEYARTQADFVAAIDGMATEAADQVVGVPAWPHWVTWVRFLSARDIWFTSEQRHNRNWNVFGVGYPFGPYAVTPSIQINLAFGPGGPALSGVFGVDDQGRRWVGHTGRLGGGRTGVTIAAFLAHYPRSETVQIDGTQREVIILGCIEEPDALVAAIADIAKAARSFREQLGDAAAQEDDDVE